MTELEPADDPAAAWMAPSRRLVAALHLYFLVLEMFLWTKPMA